MHHLMEEGNYIFDELFSGVNHKNSKLSRTFTVEYLQDESSIIKVVIYQPMREKLCHMAH